MSRDTKYPPVPLTEREERIEREMEADRRDAWAEFRAGVRERAAARCARCLGAGWVIAPGEGCDTCPECGGIPEEPTS